MNDIAKEYAKNLFESPAKSLYSNYTYERKPLGENVYIDNKKSPENIFQEWYDENKYYNYDLKKFQKNSLYYIIHPEIFLKDSMKMLKTTLIM